MSEPCIGVSAYFEFIVRAFMFHLLVKPIFEGLMRGYEHLLVATPRL